MLLVFIIVLLLITSNNCNGHSSSNLNIANGISKSSSYDNCNSHTSNLNIANRICKSNVITTLAKATPTAKLNTPAPSKKENSIVNFITSNWFILSEIIAVVISKHHPSFFKSGGPLKPGTKVFFFN